MHKQSGSDQSQVGHRREKYLTLNYRSINVDFEVAACEWLKTEDGEKTIYEKKMLNFPFQDKPELYIGGIFPITGNKYKAPELAKGKESVPLNAQEVSKTN